MTEEDSLAKIRELHSHYSHFVDDLRFDALGQLFTHDATWAAGEFSFSTRDGIVAGFAKIEPPSPGIVRHLTFHPIIRVTGDTALAWSDAIALQVLPGPAQIVAVGRYHDALRIEDGHWRFARRLFVFSGQPVPDGIAASPDYL